MLILALDPSLNSTGYAVLHYEDEVITVVEKGNLNNKKIPAALIGKKLVNIEELLCNLFDIYQFQAIVKEASFCTNKIQSTQKTFMVLGVIYQTCFKNGYSAIQDISATTVKKLVGGNGKCSKEEVKENLYYYVGYQKYATEDVSDAVAVGIAYLLKNKYKVKIKEMTV